MLDAEATYILTLLAKGPLNPRHIVETYQKDHPEGDALRVGVRILTLCSEGLLEENSDYTFRLSHKVVTSRNQK